MTDYSKSRLRESLRGLSLRETPAYPAESQGLDKQAQWWAPFVRAGRRAVREAAPQASREAEAEAAAARTRQVPSPGRPVDLPRPSILVERGLNRANRVGEGASQIPDVPVARPAQGKAGFFGERAAQDFEDAYNSGTLMDAAAPAAGQTRLPGLPNGLPANNRLAQALYERELQAQQRVFGGNEPAVIRPDPAATVPVADVRGAGGARWRREIRSGNIPFTEVFPNPDAIPIPQARSIRIGNTTLDVESRAVQERMSRDPAFAQDVRDRLSFAVSPQTLLTAPNGEILRALTPYQKEIAGLERGTYALGKEYGVNFASDPKILGQFVPGNRGPIPFGRHFDGDWLAQQRKQQVQTIIDAVNNPRGLRPDQTVEKTRRYFTPRAGDVPTVIVAAEAPPPLASLVRRHEIDEARNVYTKDRKLRPNILPVSSHVHPNVVIEEAGNAQFLPPEAGEILSRARSGNETPFYREGIAQARSGVPSPSDVVRQRGTEIQRADGTVNYTSVTGVRRGQTPESTDMANYNRMWTPPGRARNVQAASMYQAKSLPDIPTNEEAFENMTRNTFINPKDYARKIINNSFEHPDVQRPLAAAFPELKVKPGLSQTFSNWLGTAARAGDKALPYAALVSGGAGIGLLAALAMDKENQRATPTAQPPAVPSGTGTANQSYVQTQTPVTAPPPTPVAAPPPQYGALRK